ncbi:MAG: ABC-2 family transporter protein [Spirochaetota bacterium]
MRLIESFELLRDIYRLERVAYRAFRDELVERIGIGEFLSRPVRQLSLGQRMRADLAASYPFEIFERWFRRVFTFVVPLAAVSYYPGLTLLARPDPRAAYLPADRDDAILRG